MPYCVHICGICLHSKHIGVCGSALLVPSYLWQYNTAMSLFWPLQQLFLLGQISQRDSPCVLLFQHDGRTRRYVHSCLLSAGGRGAYAAIDAVAGEMTKQLSFALRDGGTVYVYGALSGDPIQVDTLDTLYKFKKVEVRTHAVRHQDFTLRLCWKAACRCCILALV